MPYDDYGRWTESKTDLTTDTLSFGEIGGIGGVGRDKVALLVQLGDGTVPARVKGVLPVGQRALQAGPLFVLLSLPDWLQ